MLPREFRKKCRTWLHHIFPASRAYTNRRFDQVCARMDARIDALEGRYQFAEAPGGLLEVQQKILAVLRLLEPRRAVDYAKIRVGTNGDGGYVQLDDMEGISHALSFGVGDNDDWDVAMAKAGIAVEQFDHTIAEAPSHHPLLHFHRKMISVNAGTEAMTVSDLVARYSKLATPDLILKIDIENSEWDIFDRMDGDVLSKFAQIACEFHNLSHLTRSEFRDRAHRVLDKLRKYFYPIHVHGNNCCGIANICNITVPDLLEVSYASRARYSFVESNETFPTPLDAPNCPKIPSIVLGTFRF
jgi:hypothetical protein